MTCSGEPANHCALPYVEGTLPEPELERFEEHYFDCPVCLARLEALQAVGRELARPPKAIPDPPREREAWAKAVFAWTAWGWAAGAVAALLLVGIFTYRVLETRPMTPTVAQEKPRSAPQTQPVHSSPAPIQASQLADLSLPIFVAPNLRGAELDAGFEAGMKEYAKGNCRGAIEALARVSAESAEARAAELYSGACRMRLGNLADAAGLLQKVADAGDSPQQEAAIYELAQIALANNDAAKAHGFLQRAISLRGDVERQARAQDRKVEGLINREGQSAGK